jgi:hypothetical protein
VAHYTTCSSLFDPCGRLEKTSSGRSARYFRNGREQVQQQSDAEKDQLYKQLGQLKVELDFLKKSWPHRPTINAKWIDFTHQRLIISQQLELLGMLHST